MSTSKSSDYYEVFRKIIKYRLIVMRMLIVMIMFSAAGCSRLNEGTLIKVNLERETSESTELILVRQKAHQICGEHPAAGEKSVLVYEIVVEMINNGSENVTVRADDFGLKLTDVSIISPIKPELKNSQVSMSCSDEEMVRLQRLKKKRSRVLGDVAGARSDAH